MPRGLRVARGCRTGGEARKPCREADQNLPFGIQLGDGVLPHNGQKNNDGNDQNVEVNVLGVRLAEPATDKT